MKKKGMKGTQLNISAELKKASQHPGLPADGLHVVCSNCLELEIWAQFATIGHLVDGHLTILFFS